MPDFNASTTNADLSKALGDMRDRLALNDDDWAALQEAADRIGEMPDEE